MSQSFIIKNLNSVFIVAELSANHNGSIETALESIKAAKESGADAIKIQTYTADTLTINCSNEYFQIKGGTLWDGKTLYELYQEAYTPWHWHKQLKDYAESLGLIFFSTPYDSSSVDFLETLELPIYKIASFEITDIPFIEYAASKGKPMIISTGISTIAEILDAVEACRKFGNNDITLLKCTSSYPASIEDANLRTMVNMKETFGVNVGLSDHTIGKDLAIAAVALGSKVIEKHFILNRNIGGPDALFSMEPDEFRSMVDSIRNVENALGEISYYSSSESIKNRRFARSLFIVADVYKGEVISECNVRSIRPNDGISPKYFETVKGRRFISDFKKGTPLKIEMIQ